MAKFYKRGTVPNFYPDDRSYFDIPPIIDYLVAGCIPPQPIISKTTRVITFGSCFADHITRHLQSKNFNVATVQLGDQIVNTYAILAQFESAWLNKKPDIATWHEYDVPLNRKLLNEADVFIMTLGLSEVWYDDPTGEVFWSPVTQARFDITRHKFRTVTHSENFNNLNEMVKLIRIHRPNATIIFTLSPIPLKATFKSQSCLVANEASKAKLRSALDELMDNWIADKNLFYLPSYELVKNCFNFQFMQDRRHIHQHVIDFVMVVFERYFCGSVTYFEVLAAFRRAQMLDALKTVEPKSRKVMRALPDGRLEKIKV